MVKLHHPLTIPQGKITLPHIVTGKSQLNIDWCWVPAGEFTMGGEHKHDGKPIHKVTLDNFWISRYPVTNTLYRHFIEAQGYQEKCWWTQAGW